MKICLHWPVDAPAWVDKNSPGTKLANIRGETFTGIDMRQCTFEFTKFADPS